MSETHQLRVLIANQRPERLALLAQVISGLGHTVIASEVHVSEVAIVTARERPDIAFVGLGQSAQHALDLISEIVKEAFCPVVALLEAYDGAWVNEAAIRGVYGYIVDSRPEELQSAIDITLRRYAETQQMEAAFRSREEARRVEAERIQAQQRRVLELNDGVVQRLTAAKLALELDRSAESSEALTAALASARLIVSNLLDELVDQGVPLQDLLRSTAPSG